MSSSFANNPIQSITAFSIKSNAVTTTTTAPIVALETTISITASTSNSSVIVAQQSSVAPIFSSQLISSFFTSTSTISTTLTPTSTSTSTNSLSLHHKSLSHGALAAIVVGSMIGVLMISGFIFLLVLRKKRSKNHRISYQNQEKSPFPIGTVATSTTPSQHFRHSYRNSTMSQNSTLRSLHSQRITNGFTLFTAAPTVTPDYSVHSPSTPIIDENFWQNSLPIGTFTIISSYRQNLDDELYIQPGDQVQIYTEYDDGWCLGINLTRGGSRGVFPQHCLDKK
ncbi:hypothetical protein INT46_006392 [Mucor plumbeus]|uniref:SH3 domain-containing protein n=1 Tax=Mucor plumbeus TaxID=97098 RepID=A0A8H7R8B7_9FUNG|nr:hypothetical protein INT46_006392 [Mucor plumbeus]